MKIFRTPEISAAALWEGMLLMKDVEGGDLSGPAFDETPTPLDLGGGEIVEVKFNSRKMQQAEPFRDRFGTDWLAVMSRVEALNEIYDDDRANDVSWLSDGADADDLGEALGDIAAIMPLNPKGLFNRNVFFKRVSQRVDELMKLPPSS